MRKIEKPMLAWIDAKLAGNGLAQKAIADKDARLVFRLAAEACVGIKEEGGNNRGTLVSLMQDTVGGPDPTAWCMSAVQTWISYAERRTGIASSIYASEHCQQVWINTPKIMRVKKIPAAGAIVIWKRGNTSSGHTGVMLEWLGNKFNSVEANTGSQSMSDGDGVFYKTRAAKQTGNLRVLGFLRPF